MYISPSEARKEASAMGVYSTSSFCITAFPVLVYRILSFLPPSPVSMSFACWISSGVLRIACICVSMEAPCVMEEMSALRFIISLMLLLPNKACSMPGMAVLSITGE